MQSRTYVFSCRDLLNFIPSLSPRHVFSSLKRADIARTETTYYIDLIQIRYLFLFPCMLMLLLDEFVPLICDRYTQLMCY